MQEQRIYTAARQLLEVQGLLTSVRQEITATQNRIERLENAPREPFEVQENLRREAGHERKLVEPLQRREQDLRKQETDLITLFNTEQTRWAEFNGRLDEIERSLAAPAVR